MLSRFKFLLSILVVCSGFSAFANSAETQNSSQNNVVLIGCQEGGDNESSSMLPPSLVVIDVVPNDFPYAAVGDGCAVALAKAKHYGWQIEFANESFITFFPGPGKAQQAAGGPLGQIGYTLIKP